MDDLGGLFERPGRSAFRRRFRLRGSERAYLDRKGLDAVLEHSRTKRGLHRFVRRYRRSSPPMTAAVAPRSRMRQVLDGAADRRESGGSPRR